MEPSELEHLKSIFRTTAVSDSLLCEIGRIVANFAIMEHELFLLVHGLLGTSGNLSRIITSELSLRNLINMASSLVKELHGEKKALLFNKTLRFVAETELERNSIIHSLWGYSGSNRAVKSKYTAKQKAGLVFKNQEYTKESLAAVAGKISRATFSIEEFRKSLGYHAWI